MSSLFRPLYKLGDSKAKESSADHKVSRAFFSAGITTEFTEWLSWCDKHKLYIWVVIFGLACGIAGWMIGDYIFGNLGASVVFAIISGALGLTINMIGCPRFTSKSLAQEFFDKL